MDLRSIRKEVHNLPDVRKLCGKFQENWLKPVRSNTNYHLPFLQELPEEVRKEVNKKLKDIQPLFSAIRNQSVNEKLHSYARHLVELKLSELRKDAKKGKLITNRLLNDEYLNIQKTIYDVQSFNLVINSLAKQYEEINDLLQKELSLEDSCTFTDLPHKIYLQQLQSTAKKQKKLVKILGKQFISMAKNG